MAGSMELYHGMVEQAGMIPVETSEELIDLATAFSSLPLPRGDRVVVVTMGGGWGVVAADACDREGVNLAALPDDLVKELDTFLPEFWSRRNPVDLVGNLRRSDQLHAIDTIMKNDEIDLLIMMGTMLGKEFFWHNLVLAVLRPLYQLVLKNIPRLPGVVQALVRGFKKSVSERQVEQSREGSAGINLAEAWLWTDYSLVTHLNRLIAATGKPIISVAMTESQKEKSGRMEGSGILTTQTPERAVYAASKLSKYSAYVKRNGRRA
jgi:acyl-CoA synthetase (NDP forming)